MVRCCEIVDEDVLFLCLVWAAPFVESHIIYLSFPLFQTGHVCICQLFYHTRKSCSRDHMLYKDAAFVKLF